MTNKLCKLLGINNPIIQIPIHTLTNGKMIAAISEAGALGILGINSGYQINTDAISGASASDTNEVGNFENYSILNTMTERNLMNEQIDSALENTFRSFGIEIPIVANLPEKDPTALALIQLMRKRRLTVALIETFNKSVSKEWINLLHQNGIKCLLQISSVKQAEKAIAAGVDALICITPKINTIVKVAPNTPIVAGYNITNTESIKSAFNQGADGIAISTLFAVCKESPLNTKIKKQILDSKEKDLVKFKFPNKLIYSLPGTLPNKLAQMTNQNKDSKSIFDSANRYQGLINGMGKGNLIAGYTDLDPDIDSINTELAADQLVTNLINNIPTL
ncbi:enoyl-[acyl-carrier-protein] reductase (NADH) [Lactobacillus crispatus]|uniref:nitronate monooxygenase n=1 Tax=Lactobacillus crispatus TaxID=47770 RepID=UPI0018E2C48A|nr:nitronate monooxygenase [Lactobacillus crispatus]MBI1694468.1 enoyl-[acyl-carrier-protein] reductase (NADH) [Lactobacillus crispatus]